MLVGCKGCSRIDVYQIVLLDFWISYDFSTFLYTPNVTGQSDFWYSADISILEVYIKNKSIGPGLEQFLPMALWKFPQNVTNGIPVICYSLWVWILHVLFYSHISLCAIFKVLTTFPTDCIKNCSLKCNLFKYWVSIFLY